MPGGPVRDFPLFPLGLVALPGEVVPLHVFEERFKQMMERCLADELEFGIVWMSDDGLREIGCACEITEVVDRAEDGQLDILTRGTRPFQLLEREDHLPYPAGVVEFLADREEAVDGSLASLARDTYAELVERATDNRPEPAELAKMGAYDMAATVDFGLDAKQGLLDMRSENARLRLVTRLFRAAMKRMEFVSHAQTRARSNGKVRFG
jgi:Lon protease-like protein